MEQSITVVWRAHHAETVEHRRMSLHRSITIPLRLISNFGARATSCPLVCSVVATYSSSRSSKRFYHNQHSLGLPTGGTKQRKWNDHSQYRISTGAINFHRKRHSSENRKKGSIIGVYDVRGCVHRNEPNRSKIPGQFANV
ncbi:uncharacterized protein LOC122570447 [Bombus pyrosoma]|uniref:uncharacterized protein LOC122570447 n=1 Tax=Bombus pyrosoma TaxID=396416 RepID=UPI001CB9228F|nr:uncharacterized protein LOC122570447 [Bombus pyrosoma]